MRRLSAIIAATVALLSLLPCHGQGVAYKFSNKILFTKSGNGTITNFHAVMPVPRTNDYQEIGNLKCSDGQIVKENNYDNRVLVVDKNSFPSNNNRYVLSTDFVVRTIPFSINTSQIKDIRPYDPESEPCKRHLGNRGEYIDLSNPYIVQTGNQLWAQSTNVIDYARRCYEHVANNFRYINGSWRTLQQILNEGGGECGDFSTLVVNLLRYKGIPSRHNICVRLNGGYHVWVDFYVEGFGWIPLDAQYKNANPRGNYFGTYDGACVILMQDFCYDIEGLDFMMDILQTCYYWYWYEGSTCDITWQQSTVNNGVATDISLPQARPAQSAIYNLQGQKVQSNYKGIVISNGRKYLMR